MTFDRSANLPVISPIWYLPFWPRSRSTPGAAASFFLFLFNFEEEEALLRLPAVEGKNRSRRLFTEYGDSGAWMMVSQMIASECGFSEVEGFSEEE